MVARDNRILQPDHLRGSDVRLNPDARAPVRRAGDEFRGVIGDGAVDHG
jgi:hypothetical protein